MTAPSTRRDVDRARRFFCAAAISSSFIAESVAPKSTVPAVNCAMPPPEPMRLVVDGRAALLLEARRPLLVDGRGNVAPAPLIVPPAARAARARRCRLRELLLSLPQAATPSASDGRRSRRQQSVWYLIGLFLLSCRCAVRRLAAARQPVTELSRDVKSV